MRLINADKLNMNDMCDHCRSACCGDCIGNDDFEKWINSQPTAYDPDKVVEQLDEQFDCTDNWDMRLAYNHAIEIVKGESNETKID